MSNASSPASPPAATSCQCAGVHVAAPGEEPIACDLLVFTSDERHEHFARTGALFSRARGVVESRDGFTLSFAPDPELDPLLASWTANEKRCCPFFSFEVTQPDAGPVVLRIAGPEGAKEILRGELEAHGLLSLRP